MNNHLAFMENASEKLRLYCINRHKKDTEEEPKSMRRRLPNKTNTTDYIPAITTNLRNNKGARMKLNVPGCPPYCKNSGRNERRTLNCQTFFLRFHVKCVSESLLNKEEERITLPECHFCQRRKNNNWH